MTKAYVIAQATVTNPEKWAEYVAKSKVALEMNEGRAIVRGGKCEIVEGQGALRNVILEFPSYDHALRYAKGAEYAAAKALRQGAGTLNMTVVEGL